MRSVDPRRTGPMVPRARRWPLPEVEKLAELEQLAAAYGRQLAEIGTMAERYNRQLADLQRLAADHGQQLAELRSLAAESENQLGELRALTAEGESEPNLWQRLRATVAERWAAIKQRP